MKIAAISDLHGNLPTIDPCDLLLIAGDICPHIARPVGSPADMRGQAHWLGLTFRKWLDRIPATHVAAVAGNHDFLFERLPTAIPKLRWHYLLRTSISIDGIHLWGTPDQLPFCDWAFNVPEESLQQQFTTIPPHTDILLSHGPPHGYGDLVPRPPGTLFPPRHAGSIALADHIQKSPPRYVITGHIHEARGIYRLGPTTIINASILDEDYRFVHQPMYFQVE